MRTLRLFRPLPRLRGRDREGEAAGTEQAASPSPPSPARGGGRRSHFAAASPIQPMIRSAICRLFLSIIIMWLLPLRPASGSSRNFAAPPASLTAVIVAAQPLRRSLPLGPGAPSLLSPHTDSIGTCEKIFATSSVF